MDKASVEIGIIGAGPAGLVLAATLAKHEGFSITIFDKGADHRAAPAYDPNRSYTIDITGHGARAVEQLGGADVFDDLLIKFKGLRILFTGEDDAYSGSSWTGSRGDICKALLRIIERDPQTSNNVRFRFDTTAEVLDIVSGTVQATHASAEPVTHRFDVVVGADGAGSQLRCAMTELPGFSVNSMDLNNYSIMLHMDKNTCNLDPGFLHIFSVNPVLVAGAINGEGGKTDPLWFCQVSFKTIEAGKKLQEMSLDGLKQLLKKGWWCKRAGGILDYVSDFELHQMQNRKPQATGKGKLVFPWSHGRCVLVGDAGAPFPPIGQGVNCGMEGAVVLGKALLDHASPGSLTLQSDVTKAFEAFTERWKPEADAVTEISRLTDVGRFANPLLLGQALLLKRMGCVGLSLAKDASLTYQQALAGHTRGVRTLRRIAALTLALPIVMGMLMARFFRHR
eukprot:TRINITY_DN3226_c0_g1_i1.p1 TRINITY_DN3226_c0_g1~~TRINITY_DN3226_c0_g1_i1.p1  ORF type:complete len:452 (+),score=68.05 TRINITY_DN3226_c0_g1_i1:49-1404(+)